MKIQLGKSDFRTKNIIKNMGNALSVTTENNNHLVEFYSEYYNHKSRKTIQNNIIYVIPSNLVYEFKQREKIESK